MTVVGAALWVDRSGVRWSEGKDTVRERWRFALKFVHLGQNCVGEGQQGYLLTEFPELSFFIGQRLLEFGDGFTESLFAFRDLLGLGAARW
ncbi:hypothetical protein GCM10010306_090680 [Streptomyces umbrinus]|nr:hypothetical protein GCM10010306_090680 [Streptomyces umbrinus]